MGYDMKNSIIKAIIFSLITTAGLAQADSTLCLEGELTEYTVINEGRHSFTIKVNEYCYMRSIGDGAIKLNVTLEELLQGFDGGIGILNKGIRPPDLTLSALKSNDFQASIEKILIERNTSDLRDLTINDIPYRSAFRQSGGQILLPLVNTTFRVGCSVTRSGVTYCSLTAFISGSDIQYYLSLGNVEQPEKIDWMTLYYAIERFLEHAVIN